MCDRILCPMKAAVRRYCKEGHDIVTAQDMQIALKERPVRGTTAAVFSLTEESRTLKIKKIPNYSLNTILSLLLIGFECGRLTTLELES